MTAPLSRRWLWLAAAAALILTFAQSPGKISPDTKLDLTAQVLAFARRGRFSLKKNVASNEERAEQNKPPLTDKGRRFLENKLKGRREELRDVRCRRSRGRDEGPGFHVLRATPVLLDSEPVEC